MDTEKTSPEEEFVVARSRVLRELDANRWVSRVVEVLQILLICVGLGALVAIAWIALSPAAVIAAIGAACRVVQELQRATARFLQSERRFIRTINCVSTSMSLPAIQLVLSDFADGEPRRRAAEKEG